MITAHIFLCRNADQTMQKDTRALDQLCARLQEEGAEVISYPGSLSDTDFLLFFQQQLPACQWFILFQTPSIVSLPEARQAVNTVLKLVEQQRMEGIVRFIAESGTYEVPPEWSALPTFDASHDLSRAVEKLLLHVSGEQSSTRAALTSLSSSPHLNKTAPPSHYDRPPAPPSRLVKAGKAMRHGTQDLLYKRKKPVIILTILLTLTLIGAGLGFFLLRSSQLAQPAPPHIPIYGHISFSSTNLAVTDATTHILDEVDVSLQNLKPPKSGESYYAWLLPDAANPNGTLISLGQIQLANGSAHLAYKSPTRDDLLATESRFLITEESTSPQPESPTADESKWRYVGELPQTPNPTDAHHLNALDYLRYLLASGPVTMASTNTHTLPGGLGVWLLQNVHLLLNWATAARGSDQLPGPGTIRNDCISILDTLDGGNLVHLDVPQGTPVLVDATVANKPILTIDPNMAIPGYIHDIEGHLLAFSASPGVTKDRQALAGQIDGELNALRGTLEQEREDARQLVAMTDQQLLDPSTIPLLDDLANQAMIAYVGQFDATTGSRQGGAISIFDHLQQLTQFIVLQYTIS
jgi:hypothetical protein